MPDGLGNMNNGKRLFITCRYVNCRNFKIKFKEHIFEVLWIKNIFEK